MTSCATLERKMDEYVLDYTFSPKFSADEVSPVAIFTRMENSPSPVLSKVAYDAATLSLLKTQRIDVVDRQKIEEILKEQEFSQSGLVDPDKAVELGKLLGAKTVLFMDFIRFESDIDAFQVRLTVKLIDVETARILYVASALGAGWNEEEAVMDAVKTALKPVIKKVRQEDGGEGPSG